MAALAAFAAPRPADVPFKKIQLDAGANETAAFADINGDGKLDVVNGENWYEQSKAKGGEWKRHRFRDLNSLVLQAEWRIMANRFMELALFYDAGKVTARRSDLDFDRLKSDYGFGVRFHGPLSTPLRIELARSHEGAKFIFASSAIF